jgi:hypothetical protein
MCKGLLLLASVIPLAVTSDAACQAFPFVMGCGFTLAISSLVVKTWRLVKVFEPMRLKLGNELVLASRLCCVCAVCAESICFSCACVVSCVLQ